MFKKLAFILMTFIFIMAPVKAEEQTGSITLTFTNNHVEKNTYYAYRIGDLVDGSIVNFVPSGNFESLRYNLDKIENSSEYQEVIKECQNLIEINKIPYDGAGVTDENNNVYIGDLKVGLYMIVQATENEIFHAEPILVRMPGYDEGNIYFDVTAKPKYTYKDPKPEIPPSENTGDNANINSYAMAFGLSFAGLVFLTLYKKRLDY